MIESRLTHFNLSYALDFAVVNQPTGFEVRVTNFATAEAHDVRVRIAVDDATAGDEAVIPAITAGETRGVTLFARMVREGYHTVTASIAHDHVPADDQRTMAVHAISRVKVLLVDGSDAREAESAR